MVKIKEQFKKNEFIANGLVDILGFINKTIINRFKENMSAAIFVFKLDNDLDEELLLNACNNLTNNGHNVFVDLHKQILSIKW